MTSSEGNKRSCGKAQTYPTFGSAACRVHAIFKPPPGRNARCLRVIRKGDRHVMQVTRLVLAAVAVMFVVASPAGAAVKPRDPRVCATYQSDPAPKKSCSHDAAQLALRAGMAHRMLLAGWDGDITCRSASVSLLVWRCSWKGTLGTGSGVIRFNRLTFKPSLVVVSNVCTQPITGDITWHGCTKILPAQPH